MNGINTFKNLKPNTLVYDLVVVIDDRIVHFRNSDAFANILSKKKNETQYTTAFCVFMNLECKAGSINFIFTPENAQIGSSKVDIGVYFGSILFFNIEAKVLPTPSVSKNSSRKEYEYVYGKGGGIQRFKSNHGVDNEDNYLSENGIIAYIKANDFEFWLQKINQWVIDASWNSTEQLQKVHFATTAKLQSKHQRNDKSEVTLYHFWVSVE